MLGLRAAQAALLAFTLVVSTSGQDVQVNIPYKKFVLTNGLTLIVHEDRKAPIVAVNVWYHVGSKNERPARPGCPSVRAPHVQRVRALQRRLFQVRSREPAATDLNGTTNNDRTNYFQNVPTSALDIALWMESDRMGHLLGVDRSGDASTSNAAWSRTKSARAKIIRTADGRDDYGNAFPAGHPYSWTVIGSMERSKAPRSTT